MALEVPVGLLFSPSITATPSWSRNWTVPSLLLPTRDSIRPIRQAAHAPGPYRNAHGIDNFRAHPWPVQSRVGFLMEGSPGSQIASCRYRNGGETRHG